MVRNGRLRTAGAALAVALVISLLTPARVAASCNPHGPDQVGNWAAFALRSAADITAVRAQLLGYRPFVPVSFTPENASAAWVGLTTYGNWAQIGWYEYDLNYRKTFAQYTANGAVINREFNPPPDWQYQEYSVSFTGGQFRFYMGRTVNPLWAVVPTFDPDRGDIASEITNLMAQMPGDFGEFPFMKFIAMEKRVGAAWSAFTPDNVNTNDNTKWYASNNRGGMDPIRELVTADKRGDCA